MSTPVGTQDPVIEVSGLTKEFGRTVALQGASLTVERG